MKKITQLCVDTHGLFFKEGLKKRYGFNDYIDTNEPTLFFGVCTDNLNIINNHNGFKLVHCITPSDELSLKHLNTENLHVFYGPHIDKNLNLNTKKIEIEFKDYSLFKPNRTGDKIYCYMRDKTEFQYDIVNGIQKNINYEIIFGGLGGNIDTYLDIETLKNKYYNNCFLNLNLSEKHGFVTVRELGLMGRKTIMNTPYDFPSIIKFDNVEHIIHLINQESTKINTVQQSINPHVQNDDWLFLEFWNN
jgi:hypothetical protein